MPEGPLADFLADPAIDEMLRNGSMFPDGGYPLGDDYAEIAHWEPFQTTYLDWILATYDPPYTGEGAEHLAFFLGMAVFDSLYGERVKLYDGALGDFDAASDIIMSSFDPMMAPSDWVPYTLFDQLYDVGYDVDPAAMMEGQNLLRIAVNFVAIFSQMPDQVAESSVPFPWGSQHLLDESVPGERGREHEQALRADASDRVRPHVERPSPTSPNRRRSTRPLGVNSTPSLSSSRRCCLPAEPGKLISPLALTTRCQGTSLPGGRFESTRPTRRARRGRPASAATCP